MHLPVLSDGGGLAKYLEEIRRFPVLEPQEEYMLARSWREHGDISAAHRLVTSHLRLVAKIAMGYRGYGLPVGELIAEGNIGMMQAVKRFDPEKGFRLATYAIWWIKAAIQEYILRSWSMVKMGTSVAQKRLFFNLRKLKNRLQAFEEGDLHPENLSKIADTLQVSEEEVTDMNRRMSGGDHSLNATMAGDGESEYIDFLADPAENQETLLIESQDLSQKKKQLAQALSTLNDRERAIFLARRLSEEPETLEELSQRYSISRERVRQIEARAMEKVQGLLLEHKKA
jgi:RNA polymerase sigma-32 factor